MDIIQTRPQKKKKKKTTMFSKDKSTRCQMLSPPSYPNCLPHTKSKPSNPNLATMVKKFMEKKSSSSSSKAVKMVSPADVIAEE